MDAGIIELLQKDGRMMYKDIAQRLHVSLPTIRSRINRLVELGVIKKFTVMVDPDKLFGRARVVMHLQIDPAKIQNIVQRLMGMKEIRELYQTSEAHTLIAKVELRSMEELKELTAEKFPRIEGVIGCTCYVVTRALKEEPSVTVEPESALQLRCDFCDGLIVERPFIEVIEGIKRYFTGRECAEAYRQGLQGSIHNSVKG